MLFWLLIKAGRLVTSVSQIMNTITNADVTRISQNCGFLGWQNVPHCRLRCSHATDGIISSKTASQSRQCDIYCCGVSSMYVLCVFLKLIKHIMKLYTLRNARNTVLIAIKALFLVT
jgi:hypothetical protein